jgi:ribosomal protein S18 acetylase RimI-like enzyme
VGNSSIQVRLLTPADAELFREIRLEALRTNPEAFGSTYEAEKDSKEQKYAAWLANSQIFGAFQGSRLVGIAAFTVLEGVKQSHKGLLRSMYVSPHSRKTGVGRKLIEAIIEAGQGRVELLHLSVVSDNHQAIRLYKSLGFEQYGLEKHALKQNGRYYDEILMALPLTR